MIHFDNVYKSKCDIIPVAFGHSLIQVFQMSVFFCTLLIFFQLYAKAEKPVCIMMGDPKYPLLSKDGDISIGAVFPVHSIETLPLFTFKQKPQLLSCSRFVTLENILESVQQIMQKKMVCLTL